MNTGKTLFTQLMDFLPWSTFDRIVARYNGNRAVRTLPCAAQYQVMAFAQITSLLSGQKVNSSNWLRSSTSSDRSGVAKIADWIGIFSNTVTENTCSNV